MNRTEDIELNTNDVDYYTMGHGKTVVNVESSDDNVSVDKIDEAEKNKENQDKADENEVAVTTF